MAQSTQQLHCIEAKTMSQTNLSLNPSFSHLHLSSIEILGKVFNLSKLRFLLCKMGRLLGPVRQHYANWVAEYLKCSRTSTMVGF